MIWDNCSKRIMAIIFTTLFTLILAFALVNSAISEDRPTLYWGSTGSSVKQVQSRLSSWGYYNGAVDGTYGAATFQAVKNFQAKNGLTVDGICGDSTWNALGFSTTIANNSDYKPATGVTRSDDANLLARLVTAEAEAEPYIGKVAVAATILNRTQNAGFPKTIAGNVFKPGEFESVSNGRANSISPGADDLRAAQDALNGYDPTYGCIYFWNPSKPVSGWIWSRQIVVRYGNHVFAK